MNIMDSLEKLYEEVETAFDEVGKKYNFTCFGCKQNCCTTLFYHYTFIEEHALHQGINTLTENVRSEILDNALEYVESLKSFSGPGKFSMMCPANKDGLCLVYRFRPMICRIHGVPSKLVFPNNRIDTYNGCAVIASRYVNFPYQLDRTAFFKRLSSIEIAFRKEIGKAPHFKFKKTLAEMILSKDLQ